MNKTEVRLESIDYRLKELEQELGVGDKVGSVGSIRRLYCEACKHKTLHLIENLLEADCNGNYIKEHRKRCVTCGTLWRYEDKVVVEKVES